MIQSTRPDPRQPTPTPRSPGLMVGKVLPGSQLTKVTPTTVTPYYYVGQLTMTFPNKKTYTGSGTLIGSKYVLTCAHNLYDVEDGGEAKTVNFVRARDGGTKPYGTIAAKKLFYPDGYRLVGVSPRHREKPLLEGFDLSVLQASWDKDYGLVELVSPVGLSTFPTPTVLTDEQLEDLTVQISGYPGESPYSGDDMYTGVGDISGIEPTELQYPITTTQGSSGSAVMAENLRVVGIHTHAGDGEYNCARRITRDVLLSLASWMT